MKKVILLFIAVLLLNNCNNDDDNNNQPLPSATQTEAGTFTCTVNGQNFIDTSGGYFNCFYQLVDGKYYFGIQGLDIVGDVTSINFGTENKTINQGSTYILLDNVDGNIWGGIGFSGQDNPFQAVFIKY
ncbi:hypothetical protein ES692_07655 [Psychroserpens burtonensis]|uniref:Lipoprotein n=1 Tax=Psychroserpens burtonensis TaxID=49278 RepID=A0A5C7BCE1_9FLAO|nr:hypothetical protein [Psychroserpens burtonensis]TXE18109.1 hypothetical protein ES692_07655 [Psychroserpens burtonensis]